MDRVHIRWIVPRDMPEIVAIETASYPTPWTEADIRAILSHTECIGLVAENPGGTVAGYVFYERRKAAVWVLNLTVAPAQRRKGIGRKLLEKVKTRASEHGRKLAMAIDECDLRAHLFLRANGVRAVGTAEHPNGITFYKFEWRDPTPQHTL